MKTVSSPLAGAGARLLAALALASAFAAQAAPTFEDSIAQRAMACTACHGKEGRAAPDGFYPRLAGKPAGYLYNQLLNFRDGRRHYGLMTGMVDLLSDDYLLEIAQYFSSLDVPYPPPLPPAAPPDVLRRGQALVQQGDPARRIPACVQCHGQALTGVTPNIPGLLGLPRDYINAQLGAWKTRQRQSHAPDCMAQIADQLGTDEVAAVSSWLAAQPLPAVTHPAAALPAPLPVACGSAALPSRKQP
ncbi:c-type cytochrome [Variovorax sp. CYS-02]|uniref:C-type cytochrome n=1 Tax=Variovorax terrae TaxID=2923278 RepID=A0A9X1VRB9_9BURK|nr:c-type cytochrome [Variovorax terrae]